MNKTIHTTIGQRNIITNKTMEKKKKPIYQKIIEAVEKLPSSAVERTDKKITKKGYDTTGYQYQFLVNVLNEEAGVVNWGYDYNILSKNTGKYSNGTPFFEATIEIDMWIKIDEEKAHRKCFGGHRALMEADALKGAFTNSFKKTAALFGVGKKAYEGTIDEDYRPQDGEIPVIDNVYEPTRACEECGSLSVMKNRWPKKEEGNNYYCRDCKKAIKSVTDSPKEGQVPFK